MPAAVFNSEGRAADCLEKRLKALAALPVDRRPSIDLESAMLHTRAVFWCHGCNTNTAVPVGIAQNRQTVTTFKFRLLALQMGYQLSNDSR